MISTEGGGELHFKALAMGHSGSGKSSLGATAPKPLILLSETQGKMSILQRAAALGVEPPTIIHMECLQDYRNVVRGLYGDKGKPFKVMDGKDVLHEGEWPETVVLDSLTKGDDGLEVISMRHWGALRDRATKLIRAFRDVPVHTLFLCLLTERLDESSDGTTTRWHGPQMPMKALPNVVMQATNLSGLLTRTSSKDPDDPKGNRILEYGVRTVGPSYLMVKPCRPLKDLEAPDFGAWVNTMKASIAGGEEA
jgi:hypothetical protein